MGQQQLILVNVARRLGEPSEEQLLGGRLMWLPMMEGDAERCRAYVESHGPELLGALECGATVVVNCQEGLHRSRQFAEQLLALQQRTAGGAPAAALAAGGAGAALGGVAEEEEASEKATELLQPDADD